MKTLLMQSKTGSRCRTSRPADLLPDRLEGLYVPASLSSSRRLSRQAWTFLAYCPLWNLPATKNGIEESCASCLWSLNLGLSKISFSQSNIVDLNREASTSSGFFSRLTDWSMRVSVMQNRLFFQTGTSGLAGGFCATESSDAFRSTDSSWLRSGLCGFLGIDLVSLSLVSLSS